MQTYGIFHKSYNHHIETTNKSPRNKNNLLKPQKLSSAFWGYNELFPLLLTFGKKGRKRQAARYVCTEKEELKKKRVILPQDHDAKFQ